MNINKDILAKLLATENITVVQEKVKTASFNVKDRILTLPAWKDMENFTYNHLVGHEVGHALYTDGDKWVNSVKEKSKGFQSFLNVVEDARIEKLIQRKYPGLRHDFIKSYKKMFAEGFFGTNIDEINSLNLIDRLNTHFKCGESFGIEFDKDEKLIVNEIKNVETFEQAVEIASRLYADAVEKHEHEQELKSEMDELIAEEEMGQSESDENESDEEYEGDANNSSQDSMEEETDDSIDTDEEIQAGNSFTNGEEFENQEPVSVTERALSDSIAEEFSETSHVENIYFSEENISQHIVPAKLVLEQYPEDQKVHSKKLFKRFLVNNKKTINYLVKEFEMKKKASEYARSSVAKTGVIDPVLMNNYRYSDDIFKKMTVTPEGKNHGLMMFLDWSGSMHNDMGNTLDQMMNLVMFCKQVQIPYRVYAFTDRGKTWADAYDNPHTLHTVTPVKKDKETFADEEFRLMEFFNSKTMKRKEINEMLELMCFLKEAIPSYYNVPHTLGLGGTPLDTAIICAPQLFDEFKKENGLDIVNMVFLTDGDSHPSRVAVASEQYDAVTKEYVPSMSSAYISHFTRKKYDYDKKEEVATKGFIHDKVTKKSYVIRESYYGITNLLLRRLRDRTNANVIGYRIIPLNKREVMSNLQGYIRNYSDLESKHAELKKNRWITIPNSGYSKFFALAGGDSMATSNGSIQVSSDATKGQIKNAFRKANKGRKESRVMLSKFIDMVA